MSFINKAYKDFILHDREICYYFDLNYIEKKIYFLKSLSSDSVKFIFPVKSFPAQDILNLVAEYSDGFDISNHAEYELVKHLIGPSDILWSSSPFIWNYQGREEIFYDVQAPEREGPTGVLRSLRVNADFLKDQLLSRFGTNLECLKKENLRLFQAIHIHHGSERMDLTSFKKIVLKLKEVITEEIGHINLGGGFTLLSDQEIKELVEFAQFHLPSKIIIFEPGRWISRKAGYCFGKVKEILQHRNETYLITSISRDCHLKWMVGPGEFGFIRGEGTTEQVYQNVIVTGPTCYEGDRISELKGPAQNLGIGDVFYVGGLSGYSFAWNHSFNGVASAQIVFIKL